MRKSRRKNRVVSKDFISKLCHVDAKIVYEEVKTKSRAGVEYIHNIPVLKKV